MHHSSFQSLALAGLILLAACATLFAGCSRSPAPLPVKIPATTVELVVEPAQLNLTAGGQAQISAQANDAAGMPVGGAHLRFRVSDARVLQVSDRGLVTSLGPATARTEVIIASGGSEKRIPVSVAAAPELAGSPSVTP